MKAHQFQNRMRELRDAKGLTQNEAADMLGVARTNLSQWETGKREMDYNTLFQLSDFY